MAEEPTEGLIKTVQAMTENVREMIAASKLLRARVESNDEVDRLMRLRMDRIEEYQKEIDRRLTTMENQNLHLRITVMEGTVNITRPS
jgi:hypothetical protein